MRTSLVPSLCSALLLGLSSAAGAGAATALPQVQAGLWEISVTVNVAGAPMAPTTVQQCFSDSDVADPQKLLPTGGNCAVSNYQVSGNSATWNMQCGGGGMTMAGSGNATFSASRFSGALTMSLGNGNTTAQMSQSFTAHRIGNCTK